MIKRFWRACKEEWRSIAIGMVIVDHDLRHWFFKSVIGEEEK